MAVISIGNVKGGAGKTTVALLLAMELARRGEKTVLLDCDPMTYATHWRNLSGNSADIEVIADVTFSNIAGIVRAQKARAVHVIIDLSGARDAVTALAAALSDLVLVPIQGCAMDARGGAHVLDLIDQVESNSRCRINRAVVLTRVNPIVTTRAIRGVKGMLLARGVRLLGTPLVERSAYRDLFDHGGSLHRLDASRISNLPQALLNVQYLARDVLALAGGAPQSVAAPAKRNGGAQNNAIPAVSVGTGDAQRRAPSGASAMRADS